MLFTGAVGNVTQFGCNFNTGTRNPELENLVMGNRNLESSNHDKLYRHCYNIMVVILK